MRHRADLHLAHLGAWMAFRGEALSGDFSAAERFLRALDPQAQGFSFRTFSDTPYTRRPGKDPLEQAIHAGLAQGWGELVELNRRGAAVCVTINESNRQGRNVEDILRVRAVFLDDDNPVLPIDRFPVPPQIQVRTSPGHYHHYWLVKGVPLCEFSELQRQLARRYGGDDRVSALNQAMQLPGIWRRKQPQRPVLPLIHRIAPASPYSRQEMQPLFEGRVIL